MTFPSDQDARDVIRTQFDRTLFVEAGAGTGKTTALVARIVHMVATGHLAEMSQLAAITFTENAAAELRNRVRQGLQADETGQYAGVAYGPEEQARLAQGLESLDDAVLTTLHGFASRILAEAALEAGLPPGFTVADARGSTTESQRSWDDFIDGLLDDAQLREHLLAGLTLGLKLTDLSSLASELGASWDRLRTRPLSVHPVPPIDADRVLGHLRDALVDRDRWPDDKLADHLRGTVAPLVDELEGLDHSLDILEALDLAEITCSDGQKPVWAKAGLDKKAVVESLKAAHEARRSVVAGVGVAVTQSLGSRVQEWLLDESERRRDSGSLEYHDLLVFARDVLRQNAEVRQRLHEQWTTLLIDEFQDTDPLQVEIACLLAGTCGDDEPGPWETIPIEEGRLFFVGDAKQSIYRFRRADIDIFTAVGARHQSARLDVNFRSVPGVLKAANTAFGALIGADPEAGIPYADLQEQRAAAGDEPPVLLLGAHRKGVSVGDLRLEESAHLADVIARARGSWTVGDGRVATYQDMAILLPTRTPLAALERALQAREIPYRIESRSLIWSTDAVRGLVAILRAADQPADEVALLAALRHPGFACSDSDLVQWRAAGGRWSIFAGTPEGLDGEHPVSSALNTLRGWHDQRWWMPVNQLVDKVVRELRLVELTASQRRPRDHWRRLRFLVDQARSWCDDDGGSGLGSFVDWCARQMDDDADVLETVVPEPDDDAVRILTVHGAKGLEFPITLVAGLNSVVTRQPKVLWTDHGPEVRLRASKLETEGWSDAAGEDKEQNRREAIRLLYVALTRAMDHLVLGCYHARISPAQQLWEQLAAGGLVRIEQTPSGVTNSAVSQDEETSAELVSAKVFETLRTELLDDIRGRVSTSPTALARERSELGAGADEPVRAVAEEGEAGASATNSQRRTSRLGAAIGTATHRVLELINDLRRPSATEVRNLTRLACAEQAIPELHQDIESRVWSALESEPLARALESGGRTMSEVYLVVRDGERFLEGYIDLLVADDDDLTILDYKTDRATSDAEKDAKRIKYEPQLAEYSSGVEAVTARRTSARDLIFASSTSEDDRQTRKSSRLERRSKEVAVGLVR